MAPKFLPGTRRVSEFCHQEIPACGGRVLDAYEDGRLLFLRSVFPGVREVRPGDGMQGGLAVGVSGEAIQVHLYLFRQVCRNGAILTHTVQTRVIERVPPAEFTEPEGVEGTILAELGEAIRAGGTAEAFAEAVAQVQASLTRPADPARDLMPLLLGMPSNVAVQILERFSRDGDRSTFGLMNAVTSVARDTPDPEMRWRLEELGGGIPARLHPSLLPDDSPAVALGV